MLSLPRVVRSQDSGVEKKSLLIFLVSYRSKLSNSDRIDHHHRQRLRSKSTATKPLSFPNLENHSSLSLHLAQPTVTKMDTVLPIALLSIVVGALIALALFGNYFRKRKSEVDSIAPPETLQKPSSKPPQSTSKKSHQIGRASCRERVCQYV